MKLPVKKRFKPEVFCKEELKKNIVKKPIFEKEVSLCKKLSKKNKGRCGWGVCKSCGVLFLLYKLHKGKLIENKTEIRKTRKKFLKV